MDMTNNKQQTAVEQFAIALYEKGLLIGNGDLIQEVLKEFKEMEKNQIMDANEDLSTANGLQYYNETYVDESNP